MSNYNVCIKTKKKSNLYVTTLIDTTTKDILFSSLSLFFLFYFFNVYNNIRIHDSVKQVSLSLDISSVLI
jgi:hypothetical protein